MTDPAMIAISDETKRQLSDAAARANLPVDLYLKNVMSGNGPMNPWASLFGPFMGGGKKEGASEVDPFDKIQKIVPTIMMMRLLGMDPKEAMGGAAAAGQQAANAKLLETIEDLRKRRDEDGDETPEMRRMNKLMFQQAQWAALAKFSGQDSDQQKLALQMRDQSQQQIEQLRTEMASRDEKHREKFDAIRDEQHKAEIAHRDEVMGGLQAQIGQLQETISNLQANRDHLPGSSLTAAVRQLAETRKAFDDAAAVFRPMSQTTPADPKDPMTNVRKALDAGSAALNEILQGVGAIQAAKHGVHPSQLGAVPQPPPELLAAAPPPGPLPPMGAPPPPPIPVAHPPPPVSGGRATSLSDFAADAPPSSAPAEELPPSEEPPAENSV